MTICEQLSNEQNNGRLLRRALKLLRAPPEVSGAAFMTVSNLAQTEFNMKLLSQEYFEKTAEILEICKFQIELPEGKFGLNNFATPLIHKLSKLYIFRSFSKKFDIDRVFCQRIDRQVSDGNC